MKSKLPIRVRCIEGDDGELWIWIGQDRYLVNRYHVQGKGMRKERVTHLIWLLWWYGTHLQTGMLGRKPRGWMSHDPVMGAIRRLSTNKLSYEGGEVAVTKGEAIYLQMPNRFYAQGERLAERVLERLRRLPKETQTQVGAKEMSGRWQRDTLHLKPLGQIKVDLSDRYSVDVTERQLYELST